MIFITIVFCSFPNCYEAEFKEPLHIDENGVPLEHLVSCLSSVELKQGIGSVKYLVWAGDKSHSESHEGKNIFYKLKFAKSKK